MSGSTVGAGKVYLIGAGPGDPGLITVKGLEMLRRADSVIYDYLSNPALLQETKGGAELIYVGKASHRHSMEQAEINQLLIALGQAGKLVVRLKGGDPFVFGRGGEEAEALRAAGVAFEIVPGVSSAIAVPAYAGIPVTHRRYVSSFTVITGHEGTSSNWAGLVQAGGTLIFLMGLNQIEQISAKLIQAGKAPTTPAATLSSGTLPQQQIVTGTLEDIGTKTRAAGLKSPGLIVVGEVVNLHDVLQWYVPPESQD
jgi:uroporphyrin-III C-methyltransferase